MNKIKLLGLISIAVLAISCSQIKTAVNGVTHESASKLDFPLANLPPNIQNSMPDTHIGDGKAIVVSVLPGKQFYVGAEAAADDLVQTKIIQALKTNPSERQLLYLNADSQTEFGDVVKMLSTIRKENIENIGLIVGANGKTDGRFSMLKVKIPAEPKDEDVPVRPNPLTLVIAISKVGKIKLNNEDAVNDNEVKAKLTQIFKDRESKGIFRAGSNDVEKTVSVKGPRSANYLSIVKLVDAAIGAGAAPVNLQIDDLEM